RRDEYWKFTNPKTLLAADPSAAFVADDEAPVFNAIDKLLIEFVDGIYQPDQSDDLKAENLEIQTLADAMASDIHWAKDLYGVLEDQGQLPVSRPFAALNTAVAEQGFVLRATGKVSRPVAFRYLRSAEASTAMIHHVIKIDAGADLTIFENGAGAARLNTCMEVDVADGAAFHHVRTQGREHDRQAITHIFGRLGAESKFKSFTVTVNGCMTRNEAVIEFTGDDAKATVAGACVGDGNFHHDDTIFVTHDAVNCESRQVFKKVLRNGATGVFQGKILVKAGAQKTDGYQISQALLIDENANFLAKPELEIYADDVICSHGSTCGATDEAAMFYLMSRGIPKKQAQDLLIMAFLDQAIQEVEDDTVADEIRDRLADWTERRSA
ncbi:MAG: SufD family Fe-S cluster assembly protein, partial [Rhodobacteraceae bacterium]|nr:SufD family Fe-S cluster assembly protein [Paracoccaceae bacterium]